MVQEHQLQPFTCNLCPPFVTYGFVRVQIVNNQPKKVVSVNEIELGPFQ